MDIPSPLPKHQQYLFTESIPSFKKRFIFPPILLLLLKGRVNQTSQNIFVFNQNDFLSSRMYESNYCVIKTLRAGGGDLG